MKIVFLDAGTLDFNDVLLTELESLGTLVTYDFTSANEAASRINDAEVLIVNKFKINEDVLSLAPRLQYITVAATGYNNIDLNASRAKNIPVSNVRAYSTTSVAQHLFAALLAVHHHSEYYFNEVSKQRWSQTKDFCFYDHSVEELYGKTMGIAGFGEIGQRVAIIAEAFGMNVLVLKHQDKKYSNEYKVVNFDQLLEESDILTLHLPLNEHTKGMINTESLNRMKGNAILINTGRGPLINETDLFLHLQQHASFTAILDVLAEEPPRNGNPLIGLPNCHITPHIAWASRQARQKLIHGLANNIKAFQQGKPINVVS